jgi:hypothetical protein
MPPAKAVEQFLPAKTNRDSTSRPLSCGSLGQKIKVVALVNRSPATQYIAYFLFLVESKAARRIYCVYFHHAPQG